MRNRRILESGDTGTASACEIPPGGLRSVETTVDALGSEAARPTDQPPVDTPKVAPSRGERKSCCVPRRCGFVTSWAYRSRFCRHGCTSWDRSANSQFVPAIHLGPANRCARAPGIAVFLASRSRSFGILCASVARRPGAVRAVSRSRHVGAGPRRSRQPRRQRAHRASRRLLRPGGHGASRRPTRGLRAPFRGKSSAPRLCRSVTTPAAERRDSTADALSD